MASIAANSKGDESGAILAHLEIHTCLISAGHCGLKIESLPVIGEVAGLEIEVKDAIVAEIEPVEELTTTYKTDQHTNSRRNHLHDSPGSDGLTAAVSIG